MRVAKKQKEESGFVKGGELHRQRARLGEFQWRCICLRDS